MIKRLTRLRIENFQSHKATSVDMDSDVLVLSGESNNGKTAALRALSWLFTNRPSGDGFVSHWAKTTNRKGQRVMAADARCAVGAEFLTTDGCAHSVWRVKTRDENYYEVDGLKLAAIGMDVPKEAADLFGFRDVNYQSQDDEHFLLSLTGSQVSAKLNELVHLDAIDAAFQYLKRLKLAAGAERRESQRAEAESRARADALKHVPAALSELEELEGMAAERREAARAARAMGAAADEAGEAALAAARFAAADGMADGVGLCASLADELRALDARRSAMDELADAAEECAARAARCSRADRKDVDGLAGLVAEWRAAEAEAAGAGGLASGMAAALEASPELPPAGDVDRLAGLVAGLASARTEMEDVQNAIAEVKLAARAAEAAGRCLEEAAGRLPDVCPLCGQPMPKEARDGN